MQHEGALFADVDSRGSAARNRRFWALAHSTALVVIFCLPFALIFMTGLNGDVAYFIGRDWLVLLVLPLLAVLFPLLSACFSSKRPLRATFWLGMLLPGIVFTILGFHFWVQTKWTQDALKNRDCETFHEKRGLQKAYDAAKKVYVDCGFAVESIERCPAYTAAEDLYSREFLYLKALEERFPCAGICGRGSTLWRDAGVQAPACGPFVAIWLQGAHMQAGCVMLYSIVVMLAALPLQFLIVDPLVASWGSKAWLS
jgi:hypothetical protein